MRVCTPCCSLCEPTSAICSNCAWKSERKTNKCMKCDTAVFLSDSGGACEKGRGGEWRIKLSVCELLFWVIYMYVCRIASTEKWLMWQHCLSLLTWQPCYRRPQVPTHTCTSTVCQCYVSVRSEGPSAPCVCVCVCACTGGEELHSDCLAVVQAPTVQVDPQLTLPLDINNYLMTHYIRVMFRVSTHTHR